MTGLAHRDAQQDRPIPPNVATPAPPPSLQLGYEQLLDVIGPAGKQRPIVAGAPSSAQTIGVG